MIVPVQSTLRGKTRADEQLSSVFMLRRNALFRKPESSATAIYCSLSIRAPLRSRHAFAHIRFTYIQARYTRKHTRSHLLKLRNRGAAGTSSTLLLLLPLFLD